MRDIEEKQLEDVLGKHKLWLNDEEGGERANLSDANLRGANGNLKQVKSIFLDTYQVTYTSEVMQIGCKRYSITEWWDFSDRQIEEMDGQTTLDWWNKYKPVLQQIIEMSPAEPTKHEDAEES